MFRYRHFLHSSLPSVRARYSGIPTHCGERLEGGGSDLHLGVLHVVAKLYDHVRQVPVGGDGKLCQFFVVGTQHAV